MNNHSIHSADRGTHLKIVAVALIAGALVMTIGLFSRGGGDLQTARIVKAGQPTAFTSAQGTAIR